MYSILKTYTFEAAHQLKLHRGKCRNLHGHSYNLEVEIYSSTLIESGPSTGMVMDFSSLDEIVEPIVAELDHAFISPVGQKESALCSKVYILLVEATAEHIARHIYDLIYYRLSGTNVGLKVRLWETGKCRVSYTRSEEGDNRDSQLRSGLQNPYQSLCQVLSGVREKGDN